MKKIDVHMHCFLHRPLLAHTGARDRFMTPPEVFAMYDRLDVELGVLLPVVSPEYANVVQGNEEVLALTQAWPDRFRWFCNVDPRNHGNAAEDDLTDTLLTYRAHGALGVGEVMANLPFDDPLTENLLRCCEKTNMPVLFHIGPQKGNCYGLIDEPGLPRLERGLQNFPNLLFIGHSQPFWCEISAGVTAENRNTYPRGPVVPGRVIKLMERYPNLTADLSANSGFNALKRDVAFACEFLEAFQDRLFFGTDICSSEDYIGLSPWLDALLWDGKLSQRAYESICRGNAERLLLSRHAQNHSDSKIE